MVPRITNVITFTFLLLLWYLFHPAQQAPQVSDAIHKGDLLVLVRTGLLQDLPHVHLGCIILLFGLPSGAASKSTV